jgi:hypothetical protein
MPSSRKKHVPASKRRDFLGDGASDDYRCLTSDALERFEVDQSSPVSTARSRTLRACAFLPTTGVGASMAL